MFPFVKGWLRPPLGSGLPVAWHDIPTGVGAMRSVPSVPWCGGFPVSFTPAPTVWPGEIKTLK